MKRRIKKSIILTVLFAMMLTLIPMGGASAAAPNFFIPDSNSLANTANLNLTLSSPAALDRTNAMIANSGTLTIAGVFQQVLASSITMTVDQYTYDTAKSLWGPVAGKSFNAPVPSQGNRFNAANVQLFPGFNRITISGLQNGVVKKDIFYVVYDTAPLLNSLQVTSNNQTNFFNEGVSLVVAGTTAAIQGNVTNAKNVLVNNQKATLLSNGLFYAPAATLKPGLNKFDIMISNDTDSITLKRQLYFYDPQKPFTIVDAKVPDAGPSTGSETNSLIGSAPTFTNDGSGFNLHLQFLIPDNGQTFASQAANNTITVNGNTVSPLGGYSTVQETVITNTYGQGSYRLVSLDTAPDVPFLADASQTPQYALSQPVNVSINYAASTPSALTLAQNFNFNLAWNQNIVKDMKLLPNYSGSGVVDSTTNMVPLDGAEITTPDFYVMVDASKAMVGGVAPTVTGATYLEAKLMPMGTASLTTTNKDVFYKINSTTTDSKKLVFFIQGLPQGSQKISFNIGGNTTTFTANVNYVSKNYVAVDNLYDGQVIPFNSTGTVALSGKFIGFGSKLLQPSQLIINNKDMSSILNVSAMNTTDGSYDFSLTTPPATLAVDRVNGPLYFGENTIKFIVNYSDGGPSQILRQYVKQMKIYIIDTNTPDISKVRPLTAPTTTRGLLSDTTASNYLPTSPEFQFSPGFYTTTLSAMDLFVEGSGAKSVEIFDGQTKIYQIDPSSAQSSTPAATPLVVNPTIYNSVDYYGSTSGFRIRLNGVLLPNVGNRTFTVLLTNTNGATATQTLEIHRENVPYTLLSPAVNTGDQIVVNKNFVLFDVQAAGATEVQINGNKAEKRTDIADRYMYTVTGLKGDADNKIKLLVKRPAGDVTRTITVKYVTDPSVGTMFMEAMGAKHTAFNKGLQLSFPKGTTLRRVSDGKVQPQVNLLFGIANPNDGNTELVNDYGQTVGTSFDNRTANGASVVLINQPLLANFTGQLGRQNFSRVSPYYWVSAGLGEQGTVGASNYRTATGGLPPYSVEGTFTNYSSGTSRKMALTQRGTITLAFNSDVVDQAGQESTVFFLGSDNTWKNLGGLVDVKNHTITVPFDDFGYYMVGKLRYSFDDIAIHGWARDIMQATFAKGYMPQANSTSFGTTNVVKREEFVTSLVRALNLKLNFEGASTFPTDVAVNSSGPFDIWNYQQIETAARAGIVQGISDGVFGAGSDLSRQDAAVMIARALDLKLGVNDTKLEAKLGKAFADGGDIGVYARQAVDAINSSGIMVGAPATSGGATAKPIINFNPEANLTRAEEAQIVVRLLQKFSKTFPTNLS